MSKKDLNSAELETVRVSRTPHKSRYDKWRSANKRGSNNARRRFGFIRGGTASGRHADSSVAWTTLRRSWVLLCVDCRSKNHTFSKNGRKIHATQKFVPIVVPGLSCGALSFSTAIPPGTSSSQDSSREDFEQRPAKEEANRNEV